MLRSQPVRPDEGAQTFGRYQVLDDGGPGGWGPRLKVRSLDGGPFYALEILPAGTKVRPAREMVAALGTVQHPGIPRLVTIEEHEGQVGLVSEWVEGPTLADVLQGGGSMPLEEALELFAGILEPVQAAHAAGVRHLALAPSRVRISVERDAIVPRVLGVGLADSFGLPDPATVRDPYRAPEQRGAVLGDARADVYALAAIFYEMLAGEAAFPAGRPTATSAPRPLHHAAPSVPVELSELIRDALAGDPARRPPTIDAFADLLYPPSEEVDDAPTQLLGNGPIIRELTGAEPAENGMRPAVVRPSIRKAPPRVEEEPTELPPDVLEWSEGGRADAGGMDIDPAGAPSFVAAPRQAPDGAVPAPEVAPAAAPKAVAREKVRVEVPTFKVNAVEEAPPSLPERAARGVARAMLVVGLPAMLLAGGLLGFAWFAGRSVHDAEAAVAAAQAGVDADLEVARWAAGRVVELGGRPEVIDEAVARAATASGLAERATAVSALRDLLALELHGLPDARDSREELARRTVSNQLDDVAREREAWTRAAADLESARSLPLAQTAVGWGFADDDPWARTRAAMAAEGR